jgi:hypothetical protein
LPLLPNVPVKEFQLDPSRNILQQSEDSMMFTTPEKKVPQNPNTSMQMQDPEEMSRIVSLYRDIATQLAEKNRMIKYRKQRLSQMERENNHKKFMYHLLKEMLRQS